MTEPVDNFSFSISNYNGNGDIVLWMKKVKLVAKLKGIKGLAHLIALHLEGDAFSVYEEMEEKDKEDSEKIETALRTAFEIDRYTAYERLQQRRWIPGEKADVYLTDLRRLAKLACIEDEEVIRGAFIVGLPTDVSQLLRAAARTAEMSLSVLCGKARIMLSQRTQDVAQDFAAAAVFTPEFAGACHAPNDSRRCCNCGGKHLAKNCERRARSPIVCWKCGETGHIARRCYGKNMGNDRGSSFAPADSQ